MRWFTNTRLPGPDRRAWEKSSSGSKVVVGPPRATVHCAVADQIKAKFAGLYEVEPGFPPLPDPHSPKNEGEQRQRRNWPNARLGS